MLKVYSWLICSLDFNHIPWVHMDMDTNASSTRHVGLQMLSPWLVAEYVSSALLSETSLSQTDELLIRKNWLGKLKEKYVIPTYL